MHPQHLWQQPCMCTWRTKPAKGPADTAQSWAEKQRLAAEKEQRTQDAIQGLQDNIFANFSEAADHFGLSQDTVWNWLNGKHRPASKGQAKRRHLPDGQEWYSVTESYTWWRQVRWCQNKHYMQRLQRWAKTFWRRPKRKARNTCHQNAGSTISWTGICG